MIYLANNNKIITNKETETLDINILKPTNNQDNKIAQITISSFNSDNSFWRKIAIFFGSDRRVIPLSIEGQRQPYYVKIQDVAKILQVHEQGILKRIDKRTVNNVKYTTNLIKKLYATNVIYNHPLNTEDRATILKNLNDSIKAEKTSIDDYCQKILDSFKPPENIAPAVNNEQVKVLKKSRDKKNQKTTNNLQASHTHSSNQFPPAKVSSGSDLSVKEFKNFLQANGLGKFINASFG